MRARNIKPGFFKNEFMAELEPLARILFSGLWCMADRDGRLEDRPKRIKAEVLPYDSCNIEKLLEQLNATRFIIRYENPNSGERYIFIPHFVEHQNPHKNEKPSEIPSVEECRVITGAVPNLHSTNRADSLIPDSLIPDSHIICPESKNDSEPPVVEIILNSKDHYPIIQKDINGWQSLFPAVDVLQELRKMAAWAEANPSKRKTKSGIRRFVVAWLSKEQDRGHTKQPETPKPSTGSPYKPMPDLRS